MPRFTSLCLLCFACTNVINADRASTWELLTEGVAALGDGNGDEQRPERAAPPSSFASKVQRVMKKRHSPRRSETRGSYSDDDVAFADAASAHVDGHRRGAQGKKKKLLQSTAVAGDGDILHRAVTGGHHPGSHGARGGGSAASAATSFQEEKALHHDGARAGKRTHRHVRNADLAGNKLAGLLDDEESVEEQHTRPGGLAHGKHHAAHGAGRHREHPVSALERKMRRKRDDPGKDSEEGKVEDKNGNLVTVKTESENKENAAEQKEEKNLVKEEHSIFGKGIGMITKAATNPRGFMLDLPGMDTFVTGLRKAVEVSENKGYCLASGEFANFGCADEETDGKGPICNCKGLLKACYVEKDSKKVMDGYTNGDMQKALEMAKIMLFGQCYTPLSYVAALAGGVVVLLVVIVFLLKMNKSSDDDDDSDDDNSK